jgi:hypothetical protein
MSTNGHDHIHTSKIKIYRDENMVRRAYIEGFEEPALFGVHSNIKDFYGAEPKEEHPRQTVVRC